MSHSSATPRTGRSESVDPRSGQPGFRDLGVPAEVVAVLNRSGITEPFPIQRATLTDSLAGRDVIGRGRTGSGKTLAFVLPLVARLAADRRRPRSREPRGLVLVPTRELAGQVSAALEPLARAVGLSQMTIYGGVGQNPQVNALHRGVDIVIACPGRLEDLMNQRHCSLAAIESTVVDEADHMADLGFLPVVKRVLDKTPRTGQRMLFSATLDNGVDVLVNRYLTNPVTHSVDPAESPVPQMVHHVFKVSREDKPAVVKALASGCDRTLLFMRTKHTAKRLAAQLTASGIPAVDLHGNLSQNVRTKNLEAFMSGEVKVMVATDIAARGIHVDDVNLVVHVDPPAEHKAFLHRSGRTARAGAEGTVVTLVMPEQKRDVDDLVRRAGISPTFTHVAPGHEIIGELVGPVAPLRHLAKAVAAPSAPSHHAQRGPKGRPQGSRGQRDRNGRPARDGESRGRSNEQRPRRDGATQGAPRSGNANGHNDSGHGRSDRNGSDRNGSARNGTGRNGSVPNASGRNGSGRVGRPGGRPGGPSRSGRAR